MARNKGTEDEFDELFALPLAEFTGARNALAARLKKAGVPAEADRVKSLAKPSISAWAVNQLYWNHREAFDRLIKAGERFRLAQASQLAGKTTDMQGPRDARREALSNLSRLAAALLRNAGHNATPDTLRRISTTLEALSAYALLPDTALPGRLTEDVDPPGFEALAALVPSAGIPRRTEKPVPTASVREQQQARDAKIASAKVALQDAERVLSEARAEAKEAEKIKHAAEDRFEKAARTVEDAVRTVEEASKELRSADAGIKPRGYEPTEADS